jgi:hypothetical protein
MTSTVHAGIAAERSTRAAWVVMLAQFGYVLWFGVYVWAALARAAHFAGHFYVPHQGDQYTADADILAGWSSGFRTLMVMTAQLQPFVVLASIGLSAWQLASKSTRRRRVLFWLPLVSSALVFATLVFPAGRSISGWILD